MKKDTGEKQNTNGKPMEISETTKSPINDDSFVCVCVCDRVGYEFIHTTHSPAVAGQVYSSYIKCTHNNNYYVFERLHRNFDLRAYTNNSHYYVL